MIPTSALAVSDLPGADADEDAYHRFALSFNGYQELGSTRRCGRIANESLEHWRRSGELPEDVDVLRACLFFEQRRWHHFGHGFNEETMRYLRDIVGRLRQALAEKSAAL